ncbi:restriction endonuclease [Mycetocola lacteus]|uniref:Restriction endonuclease n=1 Tax=Mycetocola lacteus TaxID=76637 RepID=A0A3L7ARP8_9MICO|nr:type I restriction endonuclease [Mycetocola lacteus]RLP82774.1 restriction endonuclease [Mycetocola lacteus]
MELLPRLAALAEKVRDQHQQIATEEATKNAFIMPFIATVLGYDVFNPLEVIPEFTADVGIKKGEKIDYAIMQDGEIQMLIECKKAGAPLNLENASQLFRYFAVTSARIAVLTNGVTYNFYSDIDAPNRMDEKPFLVLDLLDIDESIVGELQKLTKTDFDLDSIISAAGELKYIGQIKRVIGRQFREPDDEWVRFLTSRVYDGVITQKVREQFRGLVTKAAGQYLNDQVNERLKSALGSARPLPITRIEDDDPEPTNEVSEAGGGEAEDDGIVTTLEELEGYHIVRAIVCSDVDVDRVVYRDAKSYFAILFDDNNRKPIARLHFNRAQKYLGLIDADKNETRIPIEHPTEIYTHADALRETVRRYHEV